MALELKNVTKIIEGVHHIAQTNLTLENGTMNVLLGPTLSGKTSLMRLMAGLDRPNSGQVFWDGKDVTGMPVQKRQVAMVYQQFINYPSMTVYNNIASPLRLLKKSASEIDAAVKKAADLMQLSEMLDRKPLELSGGQQQRCALARALVKDAGLVLLDEPLANLDYKLREELRSEIPKIFEEAGSIFVYATTEPEEALLLGGNTATMWEGRVTQFGLTPDVYRAPIDVTTARVFSDPPMNFVNVSKSGGNLSFGDKVIPIKKGKFSELTDGKYSLGFRANHLSLDTNNAQSFEFDTSLIVTEFTGSETYVHMDHQGQRWVGLLEGAQNFKIGQKLKAYLNPHHINIFSEDGHLKVPASYAQSA